MRSLLVLWRRETASYFRSPIACVMLTAFLAVSGLSFWRLAMQNQERPLPLSLMLFGPVVFWLMVVAVITVVTMRLFAEEKRSGTFETLVTAPVPEATVVLGKFAGAGSFLLALCAPTVLLFVLLRAVSGGAAAIDWGPVAGGYLILVLCGGFYLSVGMFVSALTRSQVVAAVVIFSVLGTLFFAEFFATALPVGAWRQAVEYVAPTRQIMEFASGLVDSRPVVLYASGTIFMLFLTTRVVESERWR